MNSCETKIRQAINNNRLNLHIIGERKWDKYFIRITKLAWSRNLYDGYLIEVYEEQYGSHLTSVTI